MPLIPDVAGLTKKIAETLKGNEEAPSDFEKLSSQLKEDNPEKSHNIEDILSHLRSLRQIAGKGTVRDFVAQIGHKLEMFIVAQPGQINTLNLFHR